ncbi:MAG: N-acetyl-gamma-glutamyl-phosphate reductase [Gammaproteobacteria bacterium]
MIQAGIVGGSGYTGVELLRLLAQHPAVRVSCITSRAESGKRVAEVFPNLRGHVDLCFVSPDLAALAACDVVFFATPNGTAMTMVPGLLGAGVRVIDLSADFRLKDPGLWRQWYGAEHAAPELLTEAAYGLPEWYRAAIRQARLVANPGCYPTAVTLGLAPLLAEGLVREDSLIADAKSGLSGAGRKAAVATLLAEASDSLKAYGVPGHRHHPEIVQNLRGIAASAHLDLVFVPHLTPMVRGIHATLYAELRQPDADLQAVFAQRYADEPFVDVMPPGSHPETRSVRGVNQCRIAVHRPSGGRRVVVLSVIDNLVKGAAGQAIQNMNIMLGLDETAGLTGIGLLP